MDEIAEEAIAALGTVVNPEADSQQEAHASGSDPARHVTLTLAHRSLNSCDVESGWAERASAFQINRAFHDALEDTLSALAHSSVPAQSEGERRRLDDLLDEALALLRDPRRIDHP